MARDIRTVPKQDWLARVIITDQPVEGEDYLTQEQVKEIVGTIRTPAGTSIVIDGVENIT